MAGTQVKDLEVGAEAETTEELCLSLCYLSYTSQDHLPREGPTHKKLDSSRSIINQEDAPQSCLEANLMEAFCKRGSQMTPAGVKLTKI